MHTLTINGIKLDVPAGFTVLQGCQQRGIEISCYHRKLSIAGNCRMCLVEMQKSAKPIAACAVLVSDGMVIHTIEQPIRCRSQMRCAGSTSG
jgi:NADH-quinone oxidoreductase subunit G